MSVNCEVTMQPISNKNNILGSRGMSLPWQEFPEALSEASLPVVAKRAMSHYSEMCRNARW